MIRSPIRRFVIALVLATAYICQETWALAGTTGGLSGTVIDADSSSPLAGVAVTASAPSQSATAISDASGRFTFLTLSPDTYTLTLNKAGYQPESVPGQIVFADTVQTLAVRMQKALKTIARVTAAGAGALVKSGTTSDVYSINSTTQNAVGALGGGNSLNSAYSAVASVPGAYVPPNQMGYFQTVHIRGGDFDQVGYEFDGVPVNRSFDNYPSTSASSLGNSEVQVYTGATPANSEGQGLAGYINQVIKTGTYPGYTDAYLGIGTPIFYHHAAVETGGSSPDRLFSYYVGVGGYNQDFRYVDNNNGAGYDNFAGAPLAAVPDVSYSDGALYGMGPLNFGQSVFPASTDERDVVANVHIGIPHKNDAGRDDVQLLWDSSYLLTTYYSSPNDIASTSCPTSQSSSQCANTIGLGTPIYFDGFQWTCPSAIGTTSSQAALNGIGPNCTQNYHFANSTNRTSLFEAIPGNLRDAQQNNQEIVKLQYTKNLGSSAFVRLYGYSYYSNWLLDGPNGSLPIVGCCPADYELNSHTRGISLQFQDQVNAQNLLALQGSYTTASTTRDNNTQMYNAGGSRAYAAVAVNAADPYSGYCYAFAGSGSTAGAPIGCAPGGGAVFAKWSQLQTGTAPALPSSCPDPNVKSTTCTYLLAENSLYATYNSVVPRFLATSLTDEFRPSDKWLVNLGIRLDSFTFLGMDTTTGNDGPDAPFARQFWFNAYNLDNCVSNANGATSQRSAPGAPCPSGTHAANLANVSAQNFTFNEWQPRISGTYTVNPDNVVRFSFGRYTEAPNAAFEQYNTLEENLPYALLGPNLLQYGRTTPGQPIYPPTSINYDLSWEHHLRGTDLSMKVTPFLRQTQGQIQQFFLNQKTGFVSGLNVGSQRSQGLEFQMQKGDFSRNGISGMLSFAYTNSYIKYGLLSNGLTIISPFNSAIGQYNSYTKACAPGGALAGKSQFGQPLCAGTTNGMAAAACYTPAGSPDPSCKNGDIANPYWNMPGQSLMDPSQGFATYSTFPGGISSSATAYGAPYVASAVLNYKRDKFAITPSLQFVGGEKYGYPESSPGVDPAAGCPPLAGTNRYNSLTCAANLVIPDPYTGVYDNLGSFTGPNELAFNVQTSYDVSQRITLQAVLANIVNTCWGGTTEAWTYGDHNICQYGIIPGNGGVAPVGNVYNPSGHNGSIIQPFRKYPYGPQFGPEDFPKSPFQVYLTANIKI